MRPKLVALLVAAALTTGWLLASIVSPPVAELQTLPRRAEPSAPPTDAPDDRRFTEQLVFRLQSAPPPPVPRRNPFMFGESAPREVRDSARPSDTIRRVEAAAEPAPVVTGPPLRLSGIGATATETGVVRTAVLGDATTVHLVKVGETIAGYSVIDITDNTVTVEDAAGERWTLRMR